jgi:hypothetical protein
VKSATTRIYGERWTSSGRVNARSSRTDAPRVLSRRRWSSRRLSRVLAASATRRATPTTTWRTSSRTFGALLLRFAVDDAVHPSAAGASPTVRGTADEPAPRDRPLEPEWAEHRARCARFGGARQRASGLDALGRFEDVSATWASSSSACRRLVLLHTGSGWRRGRDAPRRSADELSAGRRRENASPRVRPPAGARTLRSGRDYSQLVFRLPHEIHRQDGASESAKTSSRERRSGEASLAGLAAAATCTGTVARERVTTRAEDAPMSRRFMTQSPLHHNENCSRPRHLLTAAELSYLSSRIVPYPQVTTA